MATVTLIPGDGIGPEVAEATRTVVDALGTDVEWEVHDAGLPAIDRHGEPMPPHVIESIKRNRIALKGPVTTPVGGGFRSVNVALRQELDLFASVRPCRLYPGVPSRFENIDLVVVRENTEDLYQGIELECASKEANKLRGYLNYMYGFRLPPDTALSVKPISINATRAIVDFAFDYAKRHRRRRVTLGHKANIMKFSDGLWLEEGEKLAAEYREVGFEATQVDELAMQLVYHPDDLDVIVLPNLYGDIISDLCAGLIGGLGVAPGMNLGREFAVFEPTHGSAPDIAGQGIANPIAMILSSVLMLRHLGKSSDADRLERAVAVVLAEGKHRSADLKPIGSPARTKDVSEAICSHL